MPCSQPACSTRPAPAKETRNITQSRLSPHDAAHVRNAIARFKQLEGVTDSERDAAWKRIRSAAKKHKAELNGGDWRELG